MGFFTFFKLYKWYQIAQSIKKECSHTFATIIMVLPYNEEGLQKPHERYFVITREPILRLLTPGNAQF